MVEELKKKYQHLIEKRYTQEFLERRAKHIEDAMTKKVHVVCDGQEISTTTDKDKDWVASDLWTLSTNPTVEGWETDSGHSGYGLYPEIAEYYAMCINEYQSLLSKLEKAEFILKTISEVEVNTSNKVASDIGKSFKQMAENGLNIIRS